ncbi:MAG: hypothetical protein IT384_10620 [Deltaproteobacteria bacterium]|nr:hypothetical protein [Deltaproteobacteria bacterium]
MADVRGAAMCAWVALLGACHATLDLPVPGPSAPHRSFLLILARPDETPRVFAGSAKEADALPAFTYEVQDPLPIFILYFDCDLDALGFSPGWQEVGTTLGLPLPSRASEVLRTEIADEAPVTWQAVDSIPIELIALRFPAALRPHNCAELTARLVPLPGSVDESGAVAVPLDPLTTLVATSTGHFYRVSLERAEPLTSLSTTTPHFGGYRDREGAIWLFGPGGQVARGHPATGFELTGTTSTAEGEGFPVHVDGSSGDSPLEIFVVTDDASFDRYADGRWTALADGRDDLPDWPGVLWLGPGEALAIGIVGSTVLHYRDGRIEEERLVPPEARVVATAIANAPGLGPVVGTFDGHTFVRDGGGWTLLPGDLGRTLVRVLHPFRRGFLAGLPNGVLVEFDPAYGFCESRQLAPNGTVQLLRVGEEILALTISEVHVMLGQLATVAFIRPSLPDQGCVAGDW